MNFYIYIPFMLKKYLLKFAENLNIAPTKGIRTFKNETYTGWYLTVGPDTSKTLFCLEILKFKMAAVWLPIRIAILMGSLALVGQFRRPFHSPFLICPHFLYHFSILFWCLSISYFLLICFQ